GKSVIYERPNGRVTRYLDRAISDNLELNTALNCFAIQRRILGDLMFKDLRAGTKFLILCLVSLVLTSVATYALLVEKQVAINFARSELVGSKYLALLRPIYVTVLKKQAGETFGGLPHMSPRASFASLSRERSENGRPLSVYRHLELAARV